ncbi:MAG: hypothetical protein E2O75_06810 [Chloroflexi bacterium]|nr:MAG: hypothetical protein E2O75_06810 [Chloroflexota bacterium]
MGKPENLRFLAPPMTALYSSFAVSLQGATRAFSVFLLRFFIILPRRWINAGIEMVRIVPMYLSSA